MQRFDSFSWYVEEEDRRDKEKRDTRERHKEKNTPAQLV